MATCQEYLGPLNAAKLRRIIEEPARRDGWSFEPGLADLLLAEVEGEPGALPLDEVTALARSPLTRT